YPGATPQEVAEEVSDVIETELQTMQEVDEIRSTSSDGLSIVSVDIKHAFSGTKADLQATFTRVRNKVRDAGADLPPGAGEPVVNDEYGDVYGLYYLITGPGYSIKELEDYATALRKDLLTVDGVAKVEIGGARTEAIYVEISRERAAALGVSLTGIFDDLAQQNSVVSAGDVEVGRQRLVVHPTGDIDSVTDIENVVVSAGDSGDLIYLRDVATVTRDYVDPPFSLVRFNGQQAIQLGVSNVTGANVGKLGEEIRATLSETLGERPIGVEVNEFYHQGDAVNAAVNDFAVNVALALLIVMVTLFIFMGLRSAVIIGTVLLVTIGATIVTMNVASIPLHRISLGALIIALGMLVDNAIVVTEGILVGVQKGRKKIDIAVETVAKTKWALLGGTIVGFVAFAPIGFAAGDTGEYAGHLFWVILISLLYSWLFAVTLAPMLADLIFKEQPAGGEARGDGPLTRMYKSFMRAVLIGRWLTIGLAVAAFCAAIYGFQFVTMGFFPASTTPQIKIEYWLPEGADINATARDVIEIEQRLAELEGVEIVHSVTGAGALRYMLIYSPEDPNSAFAQFIVRVDDFERIPSLVREVQDYLDANYPAAQARAARFILGPSQGAKIQAAFYGPDPAELRRLSAEAQAIMMADPWAKGVKTDWRQEVPVIEPQYDAERGRRVGVSREALANALSTTYSGQTVGVYREGDDLIPIIARAPANERADLATADTIQALSSISGDTVPISEVSDGFHVIWRDGQLRRQDRVWTLKAQCDPIPGVLASDLLNRLRPQIEAIALPEGYGLRWDGEFGDSDEANGQLGETLPFGVGAMVLVVVLLFNALRQPAAIWLVAPLILIGVVIGLLVTGTTMEFMAILGLLSLSGLLIKNAIVLVDQMDLEIREGKARFDAIVDSAASRV
ncbi:MAG: efflux RND transporter permease subunit, partial [Caulobacterales bacterium]|nr:efflux RND transporter permease subunit [Caulobacterales bacterium]